MSSHVLREGDIYASVRSLTYLLSHAVIDINTIDKRFPQHIYTIDAEYYQQLPRRAAKEKQGLCDHIYVLKEQETQKTDGIIDNNKIAGASCYYARLAK